LSGVSGGRDARPVAQEARVEAAPVETASANTEADVVEDDWDAYIKEVSARYGVPADLVAAVIEAESDNNPRAVSRRGARGLMQLMPKTARTLGVRDPFDPRANVDAGVRHLRALMDRFGNNLPLVLAAYNAGEVAVIKHRGVPPYRETRAYVKRILKKLDRRTASL
jgi:soluble lytic murein transglycosylase-like protein